MIPFCAGLATKFHIKIIDPIQNFKKTKSWFWSFQKFPDPTRLGSVSIRSGFCKIRIRNPDSVGKQQKPGFPSSRAADLGSLVGSESDFSPNSGVFLLASLEPVLLDDGFLDPGFLERRFRIRSISTRIRNSGLKFAYKSRKKSLLCCRISSRVKTLKFAKFWWEKITVCVKKKYYSKIMLLNLI
mgnify:CR=1 FL=1